MSPPPERLEVGLDALPAPLRGALPHWMERAIAAARSADQPFGAVLGDLDTGAILVEAPNSAADDPTAHAEINALRGLRRDPAAPRRLAILSTAEPCPMCAAACWWAEVAAIVYGTTIESLIRFGWPQLDEPCARLLSRGRPDRRPLIIGGYLAESTDTLYAIVR